MTKHVVRYASWHLHSNLICVPQVTQIPLETGPAAVLDGKDRTLPACPAAKAKHRTWQAVRKKTPNPVVVSYENENNWRCYSNCPNNLYSSLQFFLLNRWTLEWSSAPAEQRSLDCGLQDASGTSWLGPQLFPTSRPFANDHDWYPADIDTLYTISLAQEKKRPIENVERGRLDTSNGLRCLSIWLSSMERRRMKVSSA